MKSKKIKDPRVLIYDAVCAAICLVCVILSIVGLFTETGETELLRHKYNLGESLGTVVDLILGEGDPVYLVGKDGVRESYPAERLTVSETVIAYPEGVKKRAAARKKRADKRDATPAPEKEEAETAPIDPFDRFNLLGRTVKKSVYDGCGKPVALAGERVTPAVLSDARRKNLLLQLTVNTLTNLY